MLAKIANLTLTSLPSIYARHSGLAGKVPLEEMQDRMYLILKEALFRVQVRVLFERYCYFPRLVPPVASFPPHFSNVPVEVTRAVLSRRTGFASA